MPEGDTLWRTATALRERIQDQTLASIKPAAFERLEGRRVTGVEAYGKHLFIRFDSGLSLHSHLRMHGSWHVYKPEQRWRVAHWKAKAVLEFERVVVVGFSVPVIEIVGDGGRIEHLGPDILAEEFDLVRVLSAIRERGETSIGEVLLDQRVCAGIGNIYRCESLWSLGIDPWAQASGLSDERLSKLYRVARRLMRESALSRSVARRNAVHGRGGMACPRCSYRIKVSPQGEQNRLTYWCPRCQTEGADASIELESTGRQ